MESVTSRSEFLAASRRALSAMGEPDSVDTLPFTAYPPDDDDDDDDDDDGGGDCCCCAALGEGDDCDCGCDMVPDRIMREGAMRGDGGHKERKKGQKEREKV